MSKIGTKTYSRKPESKTSMQFDHLLSEKGNKPSTAKVSLAGVHRWGMTSFTSIRKAHLNGQKSAPVVEAMDSIKHTKVKLNKVLPSSKDAFSFEADSDTKVDTDFRSVKVKTTKPPPSRPNKFFKSGGTRSILSSNKPRSPVKNDFDALRLSVPPSYKTPKYSNILPSPIKDREIQSAENNSDLFNDVLSTEASSCFSLFGQNYSGFGKSSKFDDELSVDTAFLLSDSTLQDRLPYEKPDRMDYKHLKHKIQQDTEYNDHVILDICRTYSDSDIAPVSRYNEYSSIVTMASNMVEPVKYISLEQADCDEVKDSCTTKSSSESEQLIEPVRETLPFEPPDVLSIKDSTALPFTSNSENEVNLQYTPPDTDSISTNITVNAKNRSRSKKIFNTSKKPKAIYNHRHWQSKKDEDKALEQDSPGEIQSLKDDFDEEIQNINMMEAPLMREKRKNQASGEVVDSVTCPKPIKPLYTVVRNVKQAYQCHESGETQEFNDDIEYLLEGVQSSNGIGTRCLSILSLASKCMSPAFRIHIRAHGTMPKIFSALQDAPSDANMSLCTATLLFVLSQDRLTMDIEASTLSLMLQLLETPDIGNPELELELILEDPALCAMQDRHREKVHQLCEQMQQKGHAKHLKLDNINTAILATETLLSLTSRKAGEWFKEEIRILHGLDHIVDTISSCVDLLVPEESEVISYPTESQLDKIRKIDRCLRVLENVTYMNIENQCYLVAYKDSLLISYCLSLMKLCKSHLLENPKGPDVQVLDVQADDTLKKKPISPVLYCLLSIMKVLLNITFDNPKGCSCVGLKEGLMENVFMCIFQVPRAIPIDKRFDLLVLSLGLMINLVEHCVDNRKKIMEMYVLGSFDTVNDGYEILASEALVEVLLSRLEAARISEEQADELLSSQEVKQATEKRDSENAVSQAECLEETLMKTLQKAGKHMEHSIIAAYISLLMGCIIQNNKEYAESVKDNVPDGKFDVMVDVLKKFMSFVSLTGAVGNTGVKSIQRIIDVLSTS